MFTTARFCELRHNYNFNYLRFFLNKIVLSKKGDLFQHVGEKEGTLVN